MAPANINYKSWNLDEWVEYFDSIYGAKNKGASDQEIWLHAVEEVGELAEDFRKYQIHARPGSKGKMEGVLVNVPDTFAWLCALTKKKRGSLQDMVWNKFPNMCTYCRAEKDCICIAYSLKESDTERDKNLAQCRQNRKDEPKNMEQWQRMFHTIYGNVNHLQSLDQIAHHLMEEVGEVAKEIRLGRGPELQEEIADVFAWLIGIILKAESMSGKDIHLEDLIWERFPNMCPYCKSNPCKCSSKRIRGPRSIAS
jgi:NTP pyrophosphatase (non-canonical NTP hydrolase)